MIRPWRTVVAVISLIAIGAASGVTFDRLHHRQSNRHMALMDEVRNDPIGALDRRLSLRPEQRERVAAIIQQRQGAIDAVWNDTHIRLQATIDSVVNEIAAVLDPDQAATFRAAARELHGDPRFMHQR
jgi:hypothetical protein